MDAKYSSDEETVEKLPKRSSKKPLKKPAKTVLVAVGKINKLVFFWQKKMQWVIKEDVHLGQTLDLSNYTGQGKSIDL